MSAHASDLEPAGQPAKPMRADARRNYDKLIETARAVFHERGADCSLDEIAKRAGVGAGTLYRHFPSRDALMDAVMHDWAVRIEADSQAVVDAGLPPRDALAEWFGKFVENVGIYHGAAAKMIAAIDDPASPIYRKCQVMASANQKVLDSVRAQGALREGVDAREVMRLVSGVAGVVDRSGIDPAEARPMLDIVLDGILAPSLRS